MKTKSINGQDIGKRVTVNFINKISQPFFTTKLTGEGTGLGFCLSYNIIANGYGGELKVEIKINEGSTFIIQLPI